MSDYRRYFVPGGTYFFTLVSYDRQPRFASADAVQRLRDAVRLVQRESPFQFLAAVVLPDHMHFLWTLPLGDADYSRRIGRIKVLFTQSDSERGRQRSALSASRLKHRESDVWQRRFWEHAIDDAEELEAYLDYIHYNPVKHGFARCPHTWGASSFRRWINEGQYESSWGCCCHGVWPPPRSFKEIEREIGDP